MTTVESDAHAWNLIYLQLLLEERGSIVRNLGTCTPVDLVVAALVEERPDLLVVSSVNGHGHHGVRILLRALAARGIDVPCVAGGKLTVSEADDPWVRRDLIQRGCAEVFVGPTAIDRFQAFLDARWRTGVDTARPSVPALPGRQTGALDQTGVVSCTS
ncbi:cobalamin B12-binding domain-containing protein [Micromonospora phytophila]|uniref:cobalamin B12-binding domain-containing protein n=1 Tax=Micromonospora phytophila TaxID=709888 RepID=UPI0035575693